MDMFIRGYFRDFLVKKDARQGWLGLLPYVCIAIKIPRSPDIWHNFQKLTQTRTSQFVIKTHMHISCIFF